MTLGKGEVRSDGQKQVVMRRYLHLFNLVLETRTRDEWFVHKHVAHSVDAYLRRESFPVLRTSPGKAELVMAVPTEEGFTHTPIPQEPKLIIPHELCWDGVLMYEAVPPCGTTPDA